MLKAILYLEDFLIALGMEYGLVLYGLLTTT
jgi:hypothetical protein